MSVPLLCLGAALAACGAPRAPAATPSAAPAAAPARGAAGARLVLVSDGEGDVVRWVRAQLLTAGIEPRSVEARGAEIVVEVDPAVADAAEAAFPEAPEFLVTEVDEQWTAAEVRVPSFAEVDERTSWAGDPRRLRTIVAAPEDADRLAAALQGGAPGAGRRFVVGKNLLMVDDPEGAHALLVREDAFATGSDIRDVEVVDEGAGPTVVYVTMDDEAAEALRRVTTGRSGFRLALVLGGRVLMAPVITAPIVDGRARIDPGDGRPESAARLAEELRRSAAAPPARFERRER